MISRGVNYGSISSARVLLALALALILFSLSVGSVRAQAWASRTDMPTARGQASVVMAQDGLIYVIGGFSQGPPLTTVEAYNPATDTWSTKAPLPMATRGAAAALGPDGRIYVFNGVVHATQIYNPATDMWSTGALSPTAVWAAGAATAPDGRIYVVAGEVLANGGVPSTLLQIYDPSTDTWSAGAPLPTPRREHRVLLGPDDLIYTIGGIDGDGNTPLSSVEAYDPATDTWSTKAPLPAPRVWMGMTALCTTTYVVGGGDGTTYLTTNEEAADLNPMKIYVFGGGETYVNNSPPVHGDTFIYDPSTDMWSTGISMPTARREQAAPACPLLIEIDKAFALDDRIDMGTPATLLFHGRWAHSQTDIASTIQVNGTDYTTNATGWIEFEYTSSEVAKLTFVVTGAKSGGITYYNQTAPPVSVIWDEILVQLEVDDDRIDIGSEAGISWTAIYAYDKLQFNGTLVFNEPLSKEEVGLVEYTVAEIEDPLYGLTSFTSNAERVVFDMVKISLSASKFDVGSEANILVDAVYLYDGDPLSGTVALNDTVTKDEIGRYGYTAASVTDELYGLTVFESNAVFVIFDRVVVKLYVSDDWINVDSTAAISWEAYYEFDGEPFVGSLTLNDTLSQASVGRYGYTVSGITDEVYGLSAFASNSVTVIFDRVLVTLRVTDGRIDMGSEAAITVEAHHEYDGAPLQGSVELSLPLLQSVVGLYEYTASSINDEAHGLTVFQSNSVSVIFDRVRIQLSAEDTRINADTSAVVVWTALYEYDDTPFQGSVSLNNPLSRSDVGASTYAVESISDDLYGLSAFTSNEVEVIFDKVSVKLSVSKKRIGVGSTAQILVDASYMYDGAPHDGEVLFSKELTQTEVGEYLYEVASITGDQHGITVFEANSISIVFDRVLIQFSAPDRWSVGTTVPITWSAYYEFDGEPFQGTITLSEETTQSQVGAYEFAVVVIGDDLYELAAFAVEPVTIVFEEPVLKPEAVAAVAGVSLAGALAVAVSNMWERVQQIGVEMFGRLSGLLPEPVVDVMKYFFEGVLETRGVVEVKLAEAPLILTRQELVPLSIAGGTLALAFSYGLAPTLGDILPLLPLTLATAMGVELIKELARELTARRTGNWSEYRIWPLGLITMTISTALFKAPFSVPGKSWFHMASPSKRNEGMIAAASSVAGLLAAGVFFVLLLSGARTLGSMGLSISLALALYELIPTPPLNGKAVFDWSKPLWALLFAFSAVLYGLHVLALV